MWLTTVKSLVGGGGGGGGGFCCVVAIPPQPARTKLRPKTRTPRAFNIRTFDEFGSSGVVHRRYWKVTICRARRGFSGRCWSPLCLPARPDSGRGPRCFAASGND